MKRINIITFAIVLLLLLIHINMADAQRYIEQETYAANILADGTLETSNIPLADTQILGYTCSSSGCATVDDVLFTTSTGNDNEVTLTYPTQLQSPYGYGVFFYKPGYITWEVRADWYGTTSSDPVGPIPAYLSKVEGCRAPVDTFSVVDKVSPNQPMVIDVEAELAATTRSALFNSGPVDYIPPELKSYYQVETQLQLFIYDAQGDVVHTATRNLNVDFDGEIRTTFTYTPTTPGEYTAKVQTEVTDPKCSSQFEEFSQKDFFVFGDAPQNACIVMLNDLNALPVKQGIGDNVHITLQSQADTYNAYGQASPEDTQLNVQIQLEGNTVFQQQVFVPKADQPQQAQRVRLDWVPEEAGEHTIIVTSDIYCPYSTRQNDEVSQSYWVAGSTPPQFSPIVDQYLLKNSGDNQNLVDLTKKVSDADSDELFLSIASQSNTDLVVCAIDAQDQIDCTVKPNKVGQSLVTVQVTDKTSVVSQSFTVFVTGGDAPTLTIPDKTLPVNSGSHPQLYDLLLYADDKQDLDKDLDFQIISQTGSDIVYCSLSQNRFVDCNVRQNKIGKNTIIMQATDTHGNSVRDVFDVLVVGDIAKAQCEDGIDNDNDGFIDFPYDPGCTSPSDNDEYNVPPTKPQCSDGIDNDGDGRTDFPEDRGCFDAHDDDESGRITCSDSDGGLVTKTKGTVTIAEEGFLFEKQVDSCKDSWIVFEYTCSVDRSNQQVIRQNEIDCAYGCSHGACNPGPEPKAQCEDGIDNDNDGLVDFPNDPGCSSPSDNDEYNAPPLLAQCEDGIDNDGDGFIDFPDDMGCSSPTDDSEDSDVPPPQDVALLQVVHSAADPAVQQVDVYVNDALLLDNFAFRTATPFVEVPANTRLDIDITSAFANDNNNPLFETSINLDKDTANIVIATGVADERGFVSNPENRDIEFTLLLEEDVQTSATATRNFDFLFAQTVTDLERFDIVTRSQKSIEENVVYEDVSDYKRLLATQYIIDIVDDQNETLLRTFDASRIGNLDGQSAVVFTSGFNSSSDNQGGESLGLFAALASGQVIEFPVIPRCQDGIDNDHDGLVDYPYDPDCSSSDDDSEDNFTPVCSDGIDNDGDGLVDLADPGCSSPFDDDESDDPQKSQCEDGIDNDNDGLIDFPSDPGCSSKSDNDEYNVPPVLAQCKDGIDNDNDGFVDFPSDLGCSSASDNDESDDPIDNDVEIQLFVDPLQATGVYDGVATCTVTQADLPATLSIAIGGQVVKTQTITSLGTSVNHMFTLQQPGDYQVLCSVQDVDGDVATKTTTVTVKSDTTEFISECEDGIDNDNDGDIDSDDEACKRGMQKESDDPRDDEGLFISGIDVVEVLPDALDMTVSVRNLGSRDVDNVKISIMFPEYNMKGTLGPFDIDGRDRENKRMLIPMYDQLPTGEHLARISISSEGDHRIKHRWIWVE